MAQRGFPIGSMLVASPAILAIIRNVLKIKNGIRVIYQQHPKDEIDGEGNVIIIEHNGRDHFTARRISVVKKAAK